MNLEIIGLFIIYVRDDLNLCDVLTKKITSFWLSRYNMKHNHPVQHPVTSHTIFEIHDLR